MVLQVSNHMPIFSIDPKAVMGTDELSCDGDMRLEWGCMTEESFTAGVCPELPGGCYSEEKSKGTPGGEDGRKNYGHVVEREGWRGKRSI